MRQKWRLEKCLHLRLLLFRQALELSQLSRPIWCAGPGSNGDARRHGVLSPRVSAEFHHRRTWLVGQVGLEPTPMALLRRVHLPIVLLALGLAPSVRFELTYRGLGGCAPVLSARESWRPELDLNQRRRLRRPSTDPSAGANWGGRRESNPVAASLATISRTMRARTTGSCRRICTCCLRLIRSVLICMSFAADYWSEWKESNLLGRAPKARGQPMTHAPVEVSRARFECAGNERCAAYDHAACVFLLRGPPMGGLGPHRLLDTPTGCAPA